MVTTKEKLSIHNWVDQMTEGLSVETKDFMQKCHLALTEENTIDYDRFIQFALDEMDEANENWTFVASRIFLEKLYEEASENRGYPLEETYQHFYPLIKKLTEKGIYHKSLYAYYSQKEINYFTRQLDRSRDRLCSYLGLRTLWTRYLATDHNKRIFALPQERWMIIAMYLTQHG